MPTFDKPEELKRYLQRALGELQKETVVAVQGRLGSESVSPVDTGRMRSSWFAAEGQASSEVAPEGTDSPNTDATGLAIGHDKTYHLTNNLPYAESVAIEGRVVAKPANWFTDFANVTVPKIQAEAAAVIKQRFEL